MTEALSWRSIQPGGVTIRVGTPLNPKDVFIFVDEYDPAVYFESFKPFTDSDASEAYRTHSHLF